MGCPKMLFLYPCLIQFLVFAVAHANEVLQHFCLSNSTDNQFSNSTYRSNIDQAFTSVVSLSYTNNSGFYSASVGQNSDQVNAIALCRGDINLDGCNRCVKNSTQQLRQYCPNSKEAFIWYDNCMLRYSNRYILNNMESGPNFWGYSNNNISNSLATEFNQTVHNLLDRLSNEAGSGERLKFATGNYTIDSNHTIYALVQCTPDLSKEKCSECLNILIARLPECCVNKNLGTKQGAKILSPSCNFRYEVEPFYVSVDKSVALPSPTPSPSLSPAAPAPSTGTASLRGKKMAIAGGAFMATMLLMLF